MPHKTYNMRMITFIRDGYPVRYFVMPEKDLGIIGHCSIRCEDQLALNPDDYFAWQMQRYSPAAIKVLIQRSELVPDWYFKAMTNGL